MHSVTQYTDFMKAFFIFRAPCSFTAWRSENTYNLIYAHKKSTASMFKYSQNQKMPIRISCRFVTPDFTQIRIILLEMWPEIRVLSSVKYGLYCISFHTTHKHLIKVYGHFCISQIASKLYRKIFLYP